MAFFGLIGNDQQLSQDYGGPSASETGRRRRVAAHHRSGAKKADRRGQAWEASERTRQDRGGFWRSR
ncbi:hypothetical protein OHA98_39890 [Streptomyces sp. NBC_00654]|uniref:hypothetical protein n=1 Tax=Streptomyces sp. NBC_00654 TaxID=2975799 RepID=UPI00225C3A07|nr:hypothetical protein [Streptomyces sp. NBC_00654]MCX4970805.1 hypothetical protein [Streptomyces sp. NBC_00654]